MDIRPDLRSKVKWLLERTAGTLGPHLGMTFELFDTEKVVASMPVAPHTKQPFGLLHGGASVALAESLASIGAWLNVDESRFSASGMEINANHIRPVTEGIVTGTAVPLHRGKRTQLWEIRIESAQKKLVCVSRCTVAIVPIEE